MGREILGATTLGTSTILPELGRRAWVGQLMSPVNGSRTQQATLNGMVVPAVRVLLHAVWPRTVGRLRYALA